MNEELKIKNPTRYFRKIWDFICHHSVLIVIFGLAIFVGIVFVFANEGPVSSIEQPMEIQTGVVGEFNPAPILNPYSHPKAGDHWTVSFNTPEGTGDLVIIPNNQATIDDLDFVSLKCGEEEKTPQILEKDVIFYPNWSCEEVAKVSHLVNVAGKHTLRLEFGDKIAYAYNSSGNNFSGDTNAVALWKFDNDATDSEGDNDLTAVGSSATETLRPNAAGDEESITNSTSGAGNHWADVDDVTPDGGTTRVWDNAIGTYQRDLYNLPTHSVGSGTINFIKIFFGLRSPTGTAVYGKVSQKSGTTISNGTEFSTTSTDYSYFASQTFTTNPATGVAYTWAEIDALQIGVSLHGTFSPEASASCTQVYVEVNYTPSITYDSGDKKEGTHSIDLENSSAQYCEIADADLDAGFPGKNGTSEQSFSVCFWAKFETVYAYERIIGKWTNGSIRSWGAVLSDANKVMFFIGYGGGTSYTAITFNTAVTTGRWYHIALTYDASTNSMKIRIWDDTAGALLDSNATGTAGGDMQSTTGPLQIGREPSTSSYLYDGKFDETPFFNDVLTDDEIDQIRQGIYPLTWQPRPAGVSPSGGGFLIF